MSKASLHSGSEDADILPKSVVPVSAFQPDFLFNISSAYTLISSEVKVLGLCYGTVLM